MRRQTCRCARPSCRGGERRGLFIGVALHGATLRQDLDDNAVLYGKPLENRDIVTKGVRPPKAAARLLEVLNKYSAKERTQ